MQELPIKNSVKEETFHFLSAAFMNRLSVTLHLIAKADHNLIDNTPKYASSSLLNLQKHKLYLNSKAKKKKDNLSQH